MAPGGVDTDIQFNQLNAFAGDDRMQWIYGTGIFALNPVASGNNPSSSLEFEAVGASTPQFFQIFENGSGGLNFYSCLSGGCTPMDSGFNIGKTGNVGMNALTATTINASGLSTLAGITGTAAINFTGATSTRLRVGAGLTTTISGELGFDTISNNWHGWNGAADEILPLTSGSIIDGDCTQFSSSGGRIALVDSGVPSCGSGGGGGSVTSVATSAPITGGTITVAGTIGCATCVTSAASLTNHAIMLGQGSQASAVVGSLGTSTTVLHGAAAGDPSFSAVSLTADVSGVLPIANGGTNSSTQNFVDLTTNQASIAGNKTFSGTTTLSGAASVVTGTLSPSGGGNILASKSSETVTSGHLYSAGAANIFADSGIVASTVATAASTTTFTNKTLNQEGTGNVVTTVREASVQAAGCNASVAGPTFNLFGTSAPAVACLSLTNTVRGVLAYPAGSNTTAQTAFVLPTNLTGNVDVDVYWTGTNDGLSRSAIIAISTACSASGATIDPAFNAAQTVTTAEPLTNFVAVSSQAAVTLTGCSGGNIMNIKIGRNGASDTYANAVQLLYVRVTMRSTGK